MTKTLKTLSSAAVFLLLSSTLCRAGTTLESLKASAADLGVSLDQAEPVPVFQAAAVREPLRKGEETPFGNRAPFDAFRAQTSCLVLDSKFFVQPAVPSVLSLIRPCLESLSKTYGVEIAAGQGLVKEREGLVLTVSGPIPAGNPVVGDLQRSLEAREGVLLHVPTRVIVTYER